jgi:hypothetical protein
MPSASTTQVLAASRQWLKPLVHILIRCGVTWREFSELAKTTFVEVASSQFGKRGRPTNVSRTAVLTGLARREVRKQREKLQSAPEPLTGYVTKASLVLSAWHLDPAFLDGKGRPLALSPEGPGASFASLVRHCGGGDVRYSTLLRELRSAGAVAMRPDGKLEPILRSYVPHSMDDQLIRLWGTVMADIATTYLHNLTRTARTPARFERCAVNERIATSALPEFRKFLDAEGQAFLERVDAWLTAHEVKEGAGSRSAAVRLGAGTYHIED